MGKISPVAAKYIVRATIKIEGVVNRPDVVGAIFGQTEGLLGSDLELRELQRSGRIGRIEVEVDTKGGKTEGKIDVPSSLDKAETSLIGAALEIIQRIGPCNAKVKIEGIEDVRASKRGFVIKRAKELLKTMMEDVMPDSLELANEVTHSVRVMDIQEYGKDRLAAGPGILESDEVIVVEGRADVLNLLKYGIKNTIAVNGTSIPETVAELSKEKTITAFVDGDRGGKLIIKELFAVADIDYVTMAPDGKEVEELTKKEIHQALRSKMTSEQAKLELFKPAKSASKSMGQSRTVRSVRKPMQRTSMSQRAPIRGSAPPMRRAPVPRKPRLGTDERKSFNDLLNDLVGTRGASIIDKNLEVLGKVPTTELSTTIKSLGSGTYAVVLDGTIDSSIVYAAERAGVKFLVARESKVKPTASRVGIFIAGDF